MKRHLPARSSAAGCEKGLTEDQQIGWRLLKGAHGCRKSHKGSGTLIAPDEAR